jgi:hypothetical protein
MSLIYRLLDWLTRWLVGPHKPSAAEQRAARLAAIDDELNAILDIPAETRGCLDWDRLDALTFELLELQLSQPGEEARRDS